MWGCWPGESWRKMWGFMKFPRHLPTHSPAMFVSSRLGGRKSWSTTSCTSTPSDRASLTVWAGNRGWWMSLSACPVSSSWVWEPSSTSPPTPGSSSQWQTLDSQILLQFYQHQNKLFQHDCRIFINQYRVTVTFPPLICPDGALYHLRVNRISNLLLYDCCVGFYLKSFTRYQ